jgi:hypothetical protein
VAGARGPVGAQIEEVGAGRAGTADGATGPDFLLFERLINVVHEAAPGARIAFNTSPADTAEAVAEMGVS